MLQNDSIAHYDLKNNQSRSFWQKENPNFVDFMAELSSWLVLDCTTVPQSFYSIVVFVSC